MPNSIEIKPVETVSPAVLKQLLEIEHRCFSDPWSESMFVVSDVEGIIIATIGEKPAGFACFQHFLDECHILNVAVLPEHRKQGIGRLLINWILTRLKEARDFFLEVRESNQAAISLYEKMGFTRIGKREKYYRDGESALVMQKKRTE